MTQDHQRNIGVTELAMILSRLCFNFWFPILRNSLHVFPKTEQLWNANFFERIDTTFVVSKCWWWTSSDGNDFANTFDTKLISVWPSWYDSLVVGLLIIFIIFAPGKGNANPITFTTTPRKHEGYPTPPWGEGEGGHSREVWVGVCPAQGFQTLPLFNIFSFEYPGTSSPDWSPYIFLNS